jgi:hypothetical protein
MIHPTGGFGDIELPGGSETRGTRGLGSGQVSGTSATRGKAGATSIASAGGSFGETGPSGATEMRLPQRVRASCTPSLMTVSPACNVRVFLVQ